MNADGGIGAVNEDKRFEFYVEEAPPVTAAQRIARRAVAVLIAVVIPVVGVLFLGHAALSTGKGYQVAPVLSLMVGVLFGIPLVSILLRHVRTVWVETR